MEFSDFDEFSIAKSEIDNHLPAEKKDDNHIPARTNKDKLTDAVADNFGRILDIATDLANIKKMKVQSEAILKKMAEDRKMLVAEAEAYALKKNSDTKSVVERMNIVRMMLKDFYDANQAGVTSEDFRIIITEAINQMGKL